jgi:hypothetical protein
VTQKTYSLRLHHINQLADFMCFGEEHSRQELLESGYNENFIDKMFEYQREAAKADDAMLFVAPNLDDICLMGCNKKKPSCENGDDANYSNWLYPIHIEPGETYPFKLILDKINKDVGKISDETKKLILEREEQMRKKMKEHNIDQVL